MNCRSIFSVPVRLIGHSCFLRAKAPDPSVKKLNLPKSGEIPVETDTQKLANYVCGSNLLSEGEDIKLKPDSEYPDWLWKIPSPPRLKNLDKNTKTYWNRIRSMKQRQIKYLKSLDRTSKVHK